jgi:MSHA biogenesis protein MshP
MCRRTGQIGFSLISAIFLIVVLSALGTYMLRFTSESNMAGVLDLEGARGYQAARAGSDYGIYQVLQGGACGSSNLSFPDAGLSGWAVTVLCTSVGPYPDGVSGANITLYHVVSTACNRPLAGACPGTPDGRSYVERRLTTSISK